MANIAIYGAANFNFKSQTLCGERMGRTCSIPALFPMAWVYRTIITRLFAWRFNKELVFFTKRFNHTGVVFFSGNNTIKTHHIIYA